jgi:hypothetical protein
VTDASAFPAGLTGHLAALTGQSWPYGVHRILVGAAADIDQARGISPDDRQRLLSFGSLLLSCPPRDDLDPGLSKELLAGAARRILSGLPEDDRPAVRAAMDAALKAAGGDSLGRAAITIRNAVWHAGPGGEPTGGEDDPVWAAARYAPLYVQWLAALIDAYRQSVSH